MYDRKNFKEYVGGNSGASYIAGLKKVEEEFKVSLDEEFYFDRCSELIDLIEEKKKDTSLSTLERKYWTDRSSHVKKYVEFKSGLSSTKLLMVERKFRAWFEKQPQLNDPTKTYSDLTITAAINLLRNGLWVLGISGYDVVKNCFSITDVKRFQAIYDDCYGAAEKYDTKKGHRDFRNGLDFYLKFLKENQSNFKLKEIIKAYKADFNRIDEDERYKWEALAHFQNNWDIDAPDTVSMLKEAFKKTVNLLRSGNYYAYRNLIEFAEYDSAKVQSLFKILFDESIDFKERYETFRKPFIEYFKEKNKNHSQDLHAISVYLSFRYPEKYFIYKYSIMRGLYDRLDHPDKKLIDSLNDVAKYENYCNFCELIVSEINNDTEVQALSRKRLDEKCYQDEEYHLLATDIAYFGSRLNLDEFDTYYEGGETMSKTDINKNTILYGPPGTGKTYITARYAVAIIENKNLEELKDVPYDEIIKKYNEYKDQGRIEFTTFHQSYGYEEFIEGIKPVLDTSDEDSNDINYEVASGVFKRFCDVAGQPVVKGKDLDVGLNKNPTVWKISLWSTGDNPVRTECMENNHIRIGWDSYGPDITSETDFSECGGRNVLNSFIYKMKVGDIVMSCYSSTTVDAVGVVTGDYEWNGEYDDLNRVRKVNWLVKGINENIVDMNGGNVLTLASVYKMNVSVADALSIVEKYNGFEEEYETEKQNYVFIIDEINRGNISKIFGELITLIEPTKRLGEKEGVKVKLPYSQKLFGVPNNVYIIGTMNTADRSIAAIDTALRRRFAFKEMMPDASVIKDITVDGVSVSKLLELINERIEVLYDREHTIGHAYFTPLLDENKADILFDIFRNKIFPLLQEYFYEDYEKIRLVLGDNQKSDDKLQFINEETVDYGGLFGSNVYDYDDKKVYKINEAAFENIEAYKEILKGRS